MDCLVAARGLLVVARELLSCDMQALSCGTHAGSSSPTRDQTWAPCIRSAESYPLDHQGSPNFYFLKPPGLWVLCYGGPRLTEANLGPLARVR